ncbi:AAA family ATPase [Herbaspirillum sp. LeCh32-8]|uniref:AAA family ATPase n=1 Tax=Herbaspirillum sp. LeCh32-8 TaxID=2821356 RepID=UPI001AE0F89C|nr:AAA family ATPase [Herbaspirillum sp. LeCh32-8]MBP0597098.1 AAA family ATPase [Herbaspirillum sp. LeCh32-8]
MSKAFESAENKAFRINLFYVLTGGPGTGKTTLLAALLDAGYGVKEEAGRGVIRRQMVAGGDALPWKDRLAFSAEMLEAELRLHEAHAGRRAPVFCDRGIPDVLGYMQLEDLDKLSQAAGLLARVKQAAGKWRYAEPVFILPPWREIYETDRERRQDWATAVATHDAMRAVYAALGYRVVSLPPGSPAQRRDQVLGQLERHAG